MKYILSFLGLVINAGLLAQDVTITTGTTLTITSGTTFSIGNALTNDGTLVNNGSILIGGQWVNNGTYTPGAGSITFNSTAPVQVINHNAQSFNTLTISGGGVKQFLADITINDELILTDGILESSNNARINFGTTASFSGGSDLAHIRGTVQRSGQGTLIFPIGNGTTYLPLELLATGAGTNVSITLHEISNEVLTGDNSLAALSDKRYWELSLQGGSLSQSKIKLPVSEEGFANLDNAVVAGGMAALGPYASLGSSDFSGTPFSGSLLSELPPTVVFYALATINTDKTITVYNGISMAEDGKNDFLRIVNIEQYPNSAVSIFNRWGDRVFQVNAYDNSNLEKRFNGISDGGSVLPSGTYFYSINPGDGSAAITGYLQLKSKE